MAGCEEVPGQCNPDSGPHNHRAIERLELTDQQTSQHSGACTDLHQQECNTADHPVLEGQQSGRQRRRRRTVFTKSHLDVLELFFQKNQYPTIDHREQLSKSLSVEESRIQVWFQNRRSKQRRLKMSPGKPLMGLMDFPDDETGVKRVLCQRQNNETNFLSQVSSTGYHAYAYPSPLVQPVSQAHFQNVSYSTNLVQQQAYSNVATVTSNEAKDLNQEISSVANLFNQFRFNKAMSEMSEAPIFPVTTDLNPYPTPIPYQVPTAYGNLYNQSSTGSDSGISDCFVGSD